MERQRLAGSLGIYVLIPNHFVVEPRVGGSISIGFLVVY
jgi:hypothetical protein